MSDEEQRDDGKPHTGRLAKLILRAIDACLGVLQRLRKRFEPPDDEDARGHARGGGEPPKAAPRQRSFLFIPLVAIMCLLIGTAAGGLFSYRLFSKALDSDGTLIDFMQETIDKERKEEARLRKSLDKCLADNSGYWKETNEAKRGMEEYKLRVEDLEKQLADLKPSERTRSPVSPVQAGKNHRPQKTGDCTTGTANLTGNLTDCIEKFNRP